MILKQHIGLMSLLITCLFWIAPLQAQEIGATEPVLPTMMILRNGVRPSMPSHLSKAIQEGAENYLRHNERRIVELYSFHRFESDIVSQPMYTDRLVLARGFVELGIDLFQKMDVQGSMASLEKGLAQFRDLGHVFIDPNEVSNALLYLVLSSLDEHRDIATTLALFKEMILIDPRIDLKEGLYPENAINYFRSARQELEKRSLSEPQTRPLVAIAAKLTKTDFIASFSIVSGAEK